MGLVIISYQVHSLKEESPDFSRGECQCGGYTDNTKDYEIYQHGVQTVINALEGAKTRGLKDPQTAAVWHMGDENVLP